MWTKTFWKDAIERAIKTTAQSLVALWATGTTGILDVDWVNALSVAGLAFLMSVLTSIIGVNAGDKGTASVVRLNETQGE